MEVLLDEDKVCQVGCCCCCSGVSDSLGTFETKFCKLLTTSRPPFRGYFTVIIHVQANTWPQLCFFTSDFFHIFPLHLPIAHCPRSSIATGAILSLLWCWANVCVGIHRLESRNTLQTDGPPRGEWCTSTSVITRELYYVLCRPSRRLGCGNSSRTSRLQWRRRREPTLWWSSAPDTGQYT